MISLYTVKDETRYTISRSPYFDIIYNYFKLDFLKIDSYYKNRETRIENTNIFVRLIKKNFVDINKDIVDYINLIDIDYKYKARALEFTSTSYRGKLFRDVIGNSCGILENSFLNPFEAEDYNEISAIKIIYSDETDLYMNHPINYTDGNFVLMVDVIAVMVQYRRWCFDRLENNMNTSPNIFVYQVLYTNLIKQILEYSILNRFFNPFNVKENKSYHPFAVRDQESRLTQYLFKLYDDFVGYGIPYTQLLQNIVMPFSTNAYNLLYMTPFMVTVQNKWLVFYSRIEYTLNIIEYLGNKGITRNRETITELRYFIRYLKREYILDSIDFENRKIYIDLLYKKAYTISKKGKV